MELSILLVPTVATYDTSRCNNQAAVGAALPDCGGHFAGACTRTAPDNVNAAAGSRLINHQNGSKKLLSVSVVRVT